MKFLSLFIALAFSGSVLADDWKCKVTFNTEWSARYGAPVYAEAMIKHKGILEKKGYAYYQVGTPGSHKWRSVDVHESDTPGYVEASMFTRGELLTFTEKNVGIEATVKKLFKRFPDCLSRQ